MKDNWVTDGVKGDIISAVENLIQGLEACKYNGEVDIVGLLFDWYQTRGNDWITQTRKDLTEVDLDEEK